MRAVPPNEAPADERAPRAAEAQERWPAQDMAKIPERTWRVVTWLGILNFFAFWWVGLVLGGDALNGVARGGHFYLAEHGRLTEVTMAVWIYSLVHAISNLITLPLVVVASFRGLLHRISRWGSRGRGAV